MNRSKIYLGMSAFLLTVAGVYAAKTAKSGHTLRGHTASGSVCHTLVKTYTGTVTGTGALISTGINIPVRTVGSGTSCGQTLRTVAAD